MLLLVPVEKAWSEEARQAASEARRGKVKEKSEGVKGIDATNENLQAWMGKLETPTSRMGAQAKKNYNELRNPNTERGKRFIGELKQLPRFEGIAYRGAIITKGELDQFKEGAEFTLKLSSSASKSQAKAEQFEFERHTRGGEVNVLFSVEGKSGRDVQATPGLPASFKAEEEVVFLAGTRYSVVKSEPYKPKERIGVWSVKLKEK